VRLVLGRRFSYPGVRDPTQMWPAYLSDATDGPEPETSSGPGDSRPRAGIGDAAPGYAGHKATRRWARAGSARNHLGECGEHWANGGTMSSATNGPAGARRPRTGTGNARELLAEKLRVPRLSLAILRRRRLIDLIDQAAGHRVTVVSGPAGAGKTVACGSWASAGPASRRVAWLTLDAGDRDPARFWAYVQAALTRAGGGPAGAVGALRPGQVPAFALPPPPVPAVPVPPPAPAGSADDFALRLAEAAQLLTEPVTLVLDDAHELTGGPVLAGLDLLIRHAPPALRLILTGRCPPPLQLSRLRLSGDLADVTAADLACTPEEADAYFAMLGLEADPGARDELLRRTEGWMAGLRLAAMGAASRAETGANGPVASISGADPLVTDYLWDEVLGRQPPETRLFMLRTSVTEQTSGDLADALTGGPGGARTLERLSRENSFVEAVGQGTAVYRYHTLLREVLAAERARQIPQEIPVLLRRAARWHAAHDQAIDALRCAARAGDWDYAAVARGHRRRRPSSRHCRAGARPPPAVGTPHHRTVAGRPARDGGSEPVCR
jgi:LuxR family transcriptional regulator, maltose regulon positive regulatory protein